MSNVRIGTDFDASIIEERAGLTIIQVDGKLAKKVFTGESGGHRWQTIPPHEKRGRVHTSTVTVAVLEIVSYEHITLNPDDLEIATTRGSGAGGQHRNKTDSAVIIKHIPSGLTVRCEAQRSQHQNKQFALQLLQTRVNAIGYVVHEKNHNAQRKQQIGSGERGDKIRTIRYQDNIVTDHASGAKWELSRYLKGDWTNSNLSH